MLITVVCCTYKRPQSLGYVIRCFERQTHQDRYMVILDDAGQYPSGMSGDRWIIVSGSTRFPTLGQKRNACAALAPAGTEAFAPWDDDDLYLPRCLEIHAGTLVGANWSRPSVVLRPRADWTLEKTQTGGLYHAGMAYRRDLFERTDGYPAISGPEDQGLFRQFEALNSGDADPIRVGHPPQYIYTHQQLSSQPSISAIGCNQRAYRRLANMPGEPGAFQVVDPPMIDLAAPVIHEGIYARPF